uniref:macrophage mannose receptor 1-like n=1 Tax=Styela clava TaxID=7725 RepID=UPI001939B699|nr:macrophage mannose receptor 1-like [Styela clava]
MNLTIWMILFSTFITSASAQDPWRKECVDGFELLFYKQRKTYTSAKSSCEGLGGYLAKVDNERITAVINSTFTIQGGENAFYIGGNDLAREGDWKWQDGSYVIMRGEAGYQNWKYNQPNGETLSNTLVEDCLTLGKGTYMWTDSSCDENFYYICQKVFQGPFVGIQTINGNQKRCSATECSTATQFEWHKASNKVSTATTSRVYQTIQTGSATLNLQNANIADAGSYSCRYQIGKLWKTTTESYEVAGNPSIYSNIE